MMLSIAQQKRNLYEFRSGLQADFENMNKRFDLAGMPKLPEEDEEGNDEDKDEGSKSNADLVQKAPVESRWPSPPQVNATPEMSHIPSYQQYGNAMDNMLASPFPSHQQGVPSYQQGAPSY